MDENNDKTRSTVKFVLAQEEKHREEEPKRRNPMLTVEYHTIAGLCMAACIRQTMM
jgi:hypothetical protein